MKIKKTVIKTFKKAAHLSARTPTNEVEGYLFGMTFDEYAMYRFLKVMKRMEAEDADILKNVMVEKRGKWRIKTATAAGSLVRKYIEIKNLKFDPITLLKSKKTNRKIHLKNIFQFQKKDKRFLMSLGY